MGKFIRDGAVGRYQTNIERITNRIADSTVGNLYTEHPTVMAVATAAAATAIAITASNALNLGQQAFAHPGHDVTLTNVAGQPENFKSINGELTKNDYAFSLIVSTGDINPNNLRDVNLQNGNHVVVFHEGMLKRDGFMAAERNIVMLEASKGGDGLYDAAGRMASGTMLSTADEIREVIKVNGTPIQLSPEQVQGYGSYIQEKTDNIVRFMSDNNGMINTNTSQGQTIVKAVMDHNVANTAKSVGPISASRGGTPNGTEISFNEMRQLSTVPEFEEVAGSIATVGSITGVIAASRSQAVREAVNKAAEFLHLKKSEGHQV